MRSLRLIICCMVVLGSGCATVVRVPRDGSGAVELMAGGTVGTIAFDGGHTVNVQVTTEEAPEDEALFPHVLTIGKFSEVLGSGFTKRSNIYLESRINRTGHGTFEIDGTRYRASWIGNDDVNSECYESAVFRVTITVISRPSATAGAAKVEE